LIAHVTVRFGPYHHNLTLQPRYAEGSLPAICFIDQNSPTGD